MGDRSLEALGRAPGIYLKLGPDAKGRVNRQIFDFIGKGLQLDSACWAAQVDPAEFRVEMENRPHVRHAVMNRFAWVELGYVEEAKKGDKTVSGAKVAMEMLTRGFDAWRKRDNASLAKSLEDALIELKKQLEPEVYELVVRVLERHS